MPWSTGAQAVIALGSDKKKVSSLIGSILSLVNEFVLNDTYKEKLRDYTTYLLKSNPFLGCPVLFIGCCDSCLSLWLGRGQLANSWVI